MESIFSCIYFLQYTRYILQQNVSVFWNIFFDKSVNAYPLRTILILIKNESSINLCCRSMIWYFFICGLQLIRTDLITAMKIPDTEHLDPECYWLIVDPWKTDYDKGVQVTNSITDTQRTFKIINRATKVYRTQWSTDMEWNLQKCWAWDSAQITMYKIGLSGGS